MFSITSVFKFERLEVNLYYDVLRLSLKGGLINKIYIIFVIPHLSDKFN